MPEETTNNAPDENVDSALNDQMSIISMGEDDLENDDKKPVEKPNANESSQDTGDSDQHEEKKPEEESDDSPTPSKETESETEVDEVTEFLSEMSQVKDKPEDYKAKLEELREKDPVKYRLWLEYDRTNGLRDGFRTERQRRRDLEKQLEQQRHEDRKKDLGSFKQLSEEEQEDLKLQDPDAYVDYKLKEERVADKKEKFKQEDQEFSQNQQLNELNDFIFDKFGFDVKPETAKELDEVLPVAIREKVDKKLEALFGKDRVYTAEQINIVYDHVTKDDAIFQAKIAARQDLADSLDGAKFGSSRLDNNRPTNGRTPRQRKPEDVPLNDIHNMGEEEFSSFDDSI